MAFDRINGITGSGRFATSRRGGLTQHELAEIDRMKAKGWGKQTVAKILNRPIETVAAYYDQEKPRAAHREPERRASYAASALCKRAAFLSPVEHVSAPLSRVMAEIEAKREPLK